MSECSNRGHYARLKNTGCYVPYDPLRRVKVNPPVNCLHGCGGCNMKYPSAGACCGASSVVTKPMDAVLPPPIAIDAPVNAPILAPAPIAAAMPAAAPVMPAGIEIAPEEVEAILEARRRRRRR